MEMITFAFGNPAILMTHPQFMTPVTLSTPFISIGPGSRCLFVGSCFAAEVGTRAEASGVRATVNPVGTLYNMQSIADALRRWQQGVKTAEDVVFEGVDGLWHSRLHGSLCDGESREECLSHCCKVDAAGAAAFKEADFILVTAGTNRLYRHRESGLVVTNCHKQPAGEYTEEAQSPEKIVAAWSPWLAALPKDKQVVFTVSPYRYVKYGLHESQLAKSVLLLAIDELCRRHTNCVYFPAYEIILDELRDYRFFAADMLHVNGVAADYVWNKFREWSFSLDMILLSQEWELLRNRVNHRPRSPHSDAYRRFAEETARLAASFECKWGRPFPS